MRGNGSKFVEVRSVQRLRYSIEMSIFRPGDSALSRITPVLNHTDLVGPWLEIHSPKQDISGPRCPHFLEMSIHVPGMLNL